MADEPKSYNEHRIKVWLLVVSVATIVVLAAAALRENVFSDWRALRRTYGTLLEEKATDDVGRAISSRFNVELIQNVLPHLGRTDRCVTCHAGVDDPRMANEEQPFRTHPGRYVSIHDPSKFGCTVCHQGQGLATEVDDAHGRVAHWDYPMLDLEYTKSTCSRCHTNEELYGDQRMIDAADADASETAGRSLVERGKQLAEENGCFGCHAVGGKGGTAGPDITHVGDKTRHEFDFSHLDADAPREVEHWLKQHFLDPKSVSPGTSMPDLGLDTTQADALTAYTLSLREPVMVPDYRPASKFARVEPERRLSGRELYTMNCASCHGQDGREGTVPGIRTPALNNEDALAVASDTYYRSIITTGRSGTAMPAWGPGAGNLTPEEIDRIVSHIRGWEPEAANPADVSARTGDVTIGRRLYQGLCGNCHGRRGEGGIGNALNAPTFLAIADDRFLAEAVIEGRQGTAMASWKHLSAQEISDIVAYIRTWQSDAPTLNEVRQAARAMDRGELRRMGRTVYQGNCAVCHGRDGEGGIGTRLNSDDVLSVASDAFLHASITEGRATTAMPAWRHLDAREVAAVIEHLKSWRTTPVRTMPKAPPTGDYSLGKVHYETSCQGCHGPNGEGGSAPQLANRAFLSSASDAMLFEWIGRGRRGTAMKGFLPEEQGPTVLTRSQIADVIAYLRYMGMSDTRHLVQIGGGDPNVGRQLFAGSCASCHGQDGEGASGPQLNNAQFLASASDGFLAATIAMGRTNTPMRSMLHGAEGIGQIPPDNVGDLVAHMRTWAAPGAIRKPRPIADVSATAVDGGREMYAQHCAGCHGDTGRGPRDGQGEFAPALNNPEFLAAASDGYLLATIARGRSRTPMRPFGEGAGGIASLKPEEIAQIVSFIRSWESADVADGRR